MPAALLTAKLSPPRIPSGFVPRPRLYKLLDAGLLRRLILISAPAGYGKSTLLSSWMAGLDTSAGVAWLTLDERDNDPARFLAYLSGALQRFDPKIADGRPSELQSFQPPALEEMLAALIEHLGVDGAANDFPVRLLILDDYHLITLRMIHEGLAFLLDHLPEDLHLVISSRSDPPLPLARMRGRGQLTELRAEDLRFTEEEARRFMAGCPELNLSPDDTAVLSAKTEGWIAGLQLAALAMQGQKETAEFIKDFSGTNRFILDYLLEEVLKREARDIQDFLLRTSILDRANGPLCDALAIADSTRCGGEDPLGRGQAILEYLERANLFLIPLDERREWYRYHHLFADLLRKRLLQTAGGAGVAALHRKAAAWYGANGSKAEAVEHALAAKDFALASDLIEEDLPGALWDRGEFTTIARWMNALPGEVVHGRMALSIYYAFVLFLAGRNDAAAGLLREAEEALGPVAENAAPSLRELYGMACAIRAYMARFQGDADTVALCAQEALALLPAENTVWRGGVAMVAGDAHSLRGDTPAAGLAYAEVLRIGREAGNGYLALLASLKLATNQWLQGRLYETVETCRFGLTHAGETGLVESPSAGGLHAVWGDVLREWNDLDGALFHAETGVALCSRTGNVAVTGWCYLVLARVLLSRGDPAGAEEAVAKLERLARESDLPIWLIDAPPLLRAGIHLAQGRPEVAERILVESRPATDRAMSYRYEGGNMMLARVFFARGKTEDARTLLDGLRRETEAGGRLGRTVEILILQALVSQDGDAEKGLAALERALDLAEPEGYRRVFLEAGPAMTGLLRRLAARGRARPYIGELLAKFGGPSPSKRHEAQIMAEPLSGRELEVLRLLAAGLSKPEIARELIVAESTVRSHVKRIYAKLDAHRRREAVARAREMGWL